MPQTQRLFNPDIDKRKKLTNYLIFSLQNRIQLEPSAATVAAGQPRPECNKFYL